ncbi:UDP-N-acetylmuramoylalanine--D-glutamate ligase [Sulfuriferula plumbiphila]|uniref:UDP-N-acetylmuramoylalanine--D-glutamate ligase n=1 Tax=Sulfuriferula plumbiphila TaxID=171865 RepID=A0A512LBS9_9PROT|nr:UDP-N-acetylmuramoyl-L-alanine--D-glutamate ligase [Sulfuriferula plumbiphila]BBP05776.1 UDP-N-acetylmuramoylalanine--D-glutamate ligase [Sulfuriferula plumbiphila]GEP31852.1 UDP-N-acetylmuramoylalanine--D-glutamate ligase [Sulfuriferula plumbiphila]
MNLYGQNILVLGLGDTGLSAARWLARRGATVRVADSRSAPPNLARLHEVLPDVTVSTGPFRRADFDWAERIMVSPGVAVAGPLIQQAMLRGVAVEGDVELFAQAVPATAKVIAITGSNGKSTVTSMVGAMCAAAGKKTIMAGNIGLPVLDALDDHPEADIFVLELSSFQLETTASLNAASATVLNISEDHLDRYADLGAYAAAKARIFSGDGIQVLNRDDARSLGMALPWRTVLTFGLSPPRALNEFGVEDAWMWEGKQRLMPLAQLPLAGRHNAANALAAFALCRAVGLPAAPLVEALRRFRGLPHRVEWVAAINGIAFYDDSKGTNVGATEAALKGMDRKVVLIAGGDGKGQDFTPLRDAVAQHARAVVQIGRDGALIAAALTGAGVPVLRAETMQDAVRAAFAAARPGDAVLLSPACASFDMFNNYAHRAQVFIDAVRALPGAPA